jgi:hypothetical protein
MAALCVRPHDAHGKSAIIVCAVSLLLAACRHVEPEKSSTEAQIQQHIAGEWTLSDKSDGSWYPKMFLAEDRTITIVLTNGTRALLGTWECRDRMLRVTPRAELVEAARASGDPLNAWDYYPVVYADDHELVMAPGISVAGRLRFHEMRANPKGPANAGESSCC